MDLFTVTVNQFILQLVRYQSKILRAANLDIYIYVYILLILKICFGKMRRNHLNMRHFKIYKLIYIQQSGLAVTLKKIIMKDLDI